MPLTIRDDFVHVEIEAALRREIPVIPVLVRAATFPGVTPFGGAMKGLVYRNGIAIRRPIRQGRGAGWFAA